MVEGLASNDPSLREVDDYGYRTCEVPIVAGRYLVMAAETGHELVSLDMSDPSHPRDASRLLLSPFEYPHWIALEPRGDRIVIAGFGQLASHLRFATIERATGQITLDQESIDLNRSWPDGWKGAAVPHGTVFSNN